MNAHETMMMDGVASVMKDRPHARHVYVKDMGLEYRGLSNKDAVWAMSFDDGCSIVTFNALPAIVIRETSE